MKEFLAVNRAANCCLSFLGVALAVAAAITNCPIIIVSTIKTLNINKCLFFIFIPLILIKISIMGRLNIKDKILHEENQRLKRTLIGIVIILIILFIFSFIIRIPRSAVNFFRIIMLLAIAWLGFDLYRSYYK